MAVEEFIQSWGYLGIFLGIIATGLGFPMPEELPVVLAGGLAASRNQIHWYVMLPVCIAAVIIGDLCLYLIGRYGGRKLLQIRFIRTKLLPPERLQSISENFHEYGVKILLFARLTPGIRAPIFLTAGITHLPLTKFLIADGIYAIPGVSLLFLLGFWFTDSMVDLIRAEAEYVKPIIILVVLVGITAYLVYRFLRKPVVTGKPEEMPPVVAQIENVAEKAVNKAVEKVFHCPPDCPPGVDPQPPPADRHDAGTNGNGTSQPPSGSEKSSQVH